MIGSQAGEAEDEHIGSTVCLLTDRFQRNHTHTKAQKQAKVIVRNASKFLLAANRL